VIRLRRARAIWHRPLLAAIRAAGRGQRVWLLRLIAPCSVGIDGAGLRVEERPLLREGWQGTQQEKRERDHQQQGLRSHVAGPPVARRLSPSLSCHTGDLSLPGQLC